MPSECSAALILQMTRYEKREHKAMLKECKRPIDEYKDPVRLNALWDRIEEAKKHTWTEYQVNV